jgi:hypothetical protein
MQATSVQGAYNVTWRQASSPKWDVHKDDLSTCDPHLHSSSAGAASSLTCATIALLSSLLSRHHHELNSMNCWAQRAGAYLNDNYFDPTPGNYDDYMDNVRPLHCQIYVLPAAPEDMTDIHSSASLL